ncbi:NUDIX hydrolase [Falsiroseomonas sp.]|uniref:NUDIX hydrolase n=1 Tax=Falsiroseomonas sp. TaxID=2870721 RepID=UPI00272653C8|nr:NUDIX hydrolase [Falsiroseomonas sp.]MDO9500889.1 NUDIX hydrolase [Falsiroseomonas sp.]MDP3418020.1 NUDIX hydrolase [Falsiroseomonas sp.]
MDTEPPPWTTTHSEILLEDRWIRLRADRLRTQQGVEIAPWYVLDYPDWCVVVALTEDQRLVLVRQWRHGAQSWSLELPGGVIDRADRDPVAAAQRELQEETGYGGGEWRYLYAGHANPALQTNRLHVVLATGLRPVATATPEPTELISIEHLSVAEALEGLSRGLIGQSMHVGAICVGLAAAGIIKLETQG